MIVTVSAVIAKVIAKMIVTKMTMMAGAAAAASWRESLTSYVIETETAHWFKQKIVYISCRDARRAIATKTKLDVERRRSVGFVRLDQ